MSIADIRQPHADDAVRPVLIEINSAFIQAYRKQAKESQKTFWARFGVTQSRGSRFELGANIPKPVMILLRLYFEGRITEDDIRSVSPKRAAGPALRPALIGQDLVSRDLSGPFGSP